MVHRYNLTNTGEITMKVFIKQGLASAIAAAMLVSCGSSSNSTNLTAKKSPNFVTIVIDDMGYSDLGIFGGEVNTPNLDQMAKDGVILSNFYAAATSSVSRSLLFSGKDNHKNGLGTMRELMKRAPRVEQRDQPGYEGVLSLDTLPFPEVLQDNNYYTMMTGKWHMGGDEANEEEYYPFYRGFSATKSLLLGGGDIDYLVNENGKFLTEHTDTFINPDTGKPRKSLYNDNGKETDFSGITTLTHSTDNFTNSGIAMLNDRDTSKPFYLNMSYLAPHNPLQAPKALIDKYAPIYSVGWDKIRQQRFENLKAKGFIAPTVTLAPRSGDVKAWDDLTEREKRFEARRMAVYAAELELLDQNIGRLTQYLKDKGIYDNTVFFVYSDNGAANSNFTHPPKGLTDHNKIDVSTLSDAEFEQVLNDLGGPSSFISPNSGWGQVSNAPFRGFKADSFEGGIRGAAFVLYPNADAKATIKGTKSNCLHSVMDIAPTILEMAGISYPSEYHGKPNEPMDGISMAGIFKGDLGCGSTERSLGFELNGIKAVREGDLKISQGPNLGNHLGLYNIAKDPSEQNDLSSTFPAVYQRMLSLYQQYAIENNVIEVNSLYFKEELADATKTTAKIRGGSSKINAAGRTARFIAQRPGTGRGSGSFHTTDKVSIAGEIRPEAGHIGQFAEVFVSVRNTTSGDTYSLMGSRFEAGAGGVFKTYDALPTMVLIPIFDGVLSTSDVFKTAATYEITLSYRTADGTTISNATKPIVVVIE